MMQARPIISLFLCLGMLSSSAHGTTRPPLNWGQKISGVGFLAGNVALLVTHLLKKKALKKYNAIMQHKLKTPQQIKQTEKLKQRIKRLTTGQNISGYAAIISGLALFISNLYYVDNYMRKKELRLRNAKHQVQNAMTYLSQNDKVRNHIEEYINKELINIAYAPRLDAEKALSLMQQFGRASYRIIYDKQQFLSSLEHFPSLLKETGASSLEELKSAMDKIDWKKNKECISSGQQHIKDIFEMHKDFITYSLDDETAEKLFKAALNAGIREAAPYNKVFYARRAFEQATSDPFTKKNINRLRDAVKHATLPNETPEITALRKIHKLLSTVSSVNISDEDERKVLLFRSALIMSRLEVAPRFERMIVKSLKKFKRALETRVQSATVA